MAKKNEKTGPLEMQPDEALTFCRTVKGWPNAYIPEKKELDKGVLSPHTVYQRKPKDLFDTPEEFYFQPSAHAALNQG